VSNQKWRTTGNDDPWFQVALLWQAEQYRNGQRNTPATRGTRRIKKQNYNHDARRQLRQSSTEQQESDKHTEKTQDQL